MEEIEKEIREIEKFTKLSEKQLDMLLGHEIRYFNDKDNCEKGIIASYKREKSYVRVYLTNGFEILLF